MQSKNLRNKSITEICKTDNCLKFSLASNMVEERDSKAKTRATLSILAKILSCSLGPYGSTTVIQNREGNHLTTKDGYDIINNLLIRDDVSKTILDIIRRIASEQVHSVGDGSTSSIMVANALYDILSDPERVEFFERITAKDITNILNDVSDYLEVEIKNQGIPLTEDNIDLLDEIATIATNNDEKTGKYIADIYKKIGEHGFISTNVLNKLYKDHVDYQAGYEWDRGYVDVVYGQFSENGKVQYDSPKIFITDAFLTEKDMPIIVRLLETVPVKTRKKMVIVANGYDDCISVLLKTNRLTHLTNKKYEELDFTPVDIHQAHSLNVELLKDLAACCGCKIYKKHEYGEETINIVADNIEPYIGEVKRAIISPKSTQIITPDKDTLTQEYQDIIKRKKQEINEQMEDLFAKNNKDMESTYPLRKRLACINGAVACLHVGGKTFEERKSRERLIEDAIYACKSALKHGYIIGGNLLTSRILFKKDKRDILINTLKEKYHYLQYDSIEDFLEDFLKLIGTAFLSSYRSVLENSYLDSQSINDIIEKCINSEMFYNLKTHKFESDSETSVINSTETDLQIIKSTFSIIGSLATSNQMLILNLNNDVYFKEE